MTKDNKAETLVGIIKKLVSCVYGEEYDSEKYYDFSLEETRKLFDIISLEEFIKSCREGHIMWMEHFLEDNDIHPKTFCY